MDIHKNARLTMIMREQLAKRVLERVLTLKKAAACFQIREAKAAKGVRRYRTEGLFGLQDRSSRPRRLYRPTAPELIERVRRLRLERWTGCAFPGTPDSAGLP